MKPEMSAIIVEVPLNDLPKSTVETLKNEAIRCGDSIDKLIAKGAINLAKQIVASQQTSRKPRKS